MKRTIHILLATALAVSCALALNVDANTKIVVGEDDQVTRGRLVSSMMLTSNQIISADEASAGDTLIAIGGPCVNELWEQYSTITCGSWPYDEGEGLILSVEEGDVTLVAGTTAEDTQLLLERFILDTPKNAQKNGTNKTSAWTTTTRTTNPNSWTTNTNTTSSRTVNRTTNRTSIYDDLRENDTEDNDSESVWDRYRRSVSNQTNNNSLEGGDTFTVRDGQSTSIRLDGKTLTVDDVSIDDDMLTLTIDGTTRSDLEVEDTFSVSGMSMRVDDISTSSATLEVQ